MVIIKIPVDYESIFDSNMVIITGVARSGTSIAGKIIGSLSNTCYRFEPAFFRLFPTLIKKGTISKNEGAQLFKSMLFEDLFLQRLHGRYVNFNKKDLSYIGNYTDVDAIKERWSEFRRRKDVIEHLENNDYNFVLKIPNLQPVVDTLDSIFSDIKFVHMLRDGNDVITSSIRRDFYTEEYFNDRKIEWSSEEINGLKIPWYVKEKNQFAKWNQHTRSAHIWRVLNENWNDYSNKKSENTLNIKFENFRKNPEKYLEKVEDFMDKKRTDITKKHIESVKEHKPKDYPNNIEHIESPEEEKYQSFRKKLGYEQI